MRQTKTTLLTLLNSLNCQVFYNHTTSKDVVNLPFIVLLENSSSNVFGDNSTYFDIMNYTIILHTTNPDDTLIGSIKTLLTDNHIPYEFDGINWDNDLLFYQVQFSIQQ